jgi:long-subunit acyl-CoA synthetase (AMP-forming)
MKRAVLCVSNPENYIQDLNDYSVMIVNPESPESRKHYLLEKSDYSLLITNTRQIARNGSDYADEKVFWYTSGTTGDSKFCSFNQTQLHNMAQTLCRAYDITSNDRYVGVMPLWHAHGQGFYWATKLAGCTSTFLSVTRLRTIANLSPTFITAVPHVLKILAQLNFDSLRFIRSASAALQDDLYMALKNKFRVPVIEAFGMTEALSHCFTNPLHGEQRMGTIGLPDGIQAKIESGHLMIQGPNVFQSGWYDTGDLAEYDSFGYYKILGRSRDQINIKGKKFNPISLETQLLKHIPGLTECVIFGSDKLKCLWVGESNPDFIKHCLINMDHQLKPTLLEKVKSIPKLGDKISRSWLDKNY